MNQFSSWLNNVSSQVSSAFTAPPVEEEEKGEREQSEAETKKESNDSGRRASQTAAEAWQNASQMGGASCDLFFTSKVFYF